MKKLNNKGFAISSLLYGLLLVAFLVVTVLMSIMASNRKNTSSLIEKIDDELSRHSNTVTEFSSQPEAQEFIVPYGKAGWYKIELWGAAGAGSIGDTNANRGSYTSGTVYLEENAHLYFYVGATGVAGGTTYNQLNSPTAGGGGATDVRMVSGGANWNDQLSKDSIMMLAGGGANGGRLHDSAYSAYSAGASYIAGFGGQRVYTTPTGKTYSFVGGLMLHAVNGGAGKARIELISQNPSNVAPAKRSNIITNVTRIRDCLTVDLTTSLNGGKELWTEAQAIVTEYGGNRGYNLIKITDTSVVTSKTPNTTLLSDGSIVTNFSRTMNYVSGTNKRYCLDIQFSRGFELEEVSFFHYKDSTTTLKKEEIYINSTLVKTYDYSAGKPYIPAENIMGRRLSDVHIESINTIPTANYYIASAIDDGRVLTATTSETDKNPTKLMFFDALKKQKWTISAVDGTSNTYKIVEIEDNTALQPKQTDADGKIAANSFVSTLAPFTGQDWEKWIIEPADGSAKNEYYRIKLKSDPSYCLTIHEETQGSPIKLATCNSTDKNVSKMQQFRFINAEY